MSAVLAGFVTLTVVPRAAVQGAEPAVRLERAVISP